MTITDGRPISPEQVADLSKGDELAVRAERVLTSPQFDEAKRKAFALARVPA